MLERQRKFVENILLQKIYVDTTRKNITIRVPGTFCGYEFISFIGKGSYGCVALVKLKLTGKLYAAKVYSKKGMQKAGMLESVQNEIDVLRTVRHENIVKFVESFTIKDDKNDEFIVIVTDYYEGGNLAQLIESKRVKHLNIKKFFFQIVAAVKAIHEKGKKQSICLGLRLRKGSLVLRALSILNCEVIIIIIKH